MKKFKIPKFFKPSFKDSDRDGVMDHFDCKPFDKKRQEVFDIRKMKDKKKVLKGNLYHKTDFSNLKSIMKSNTLKVQSGRPISLSDTSNVDVKHKKYKQPIVLVFNKDQIPGKRKMDYNREGTFKGEREWTTEHFPVKKALKGVLLNEKIKERHGALGRERWGTHTRYVTDKDILKVKFKG